MERQRTDCEDLARRLGWPVARVFTDNDVSASTGRRRPEYEAMLTAVQSGEVTAILAWHTDRLHRRPTELERFIDIIREHDVAVQTVRAGELDLSTASGQMVARMLGVIAKGETDRSQERIRAQKAQAASRGVYRGGPRPFGYLADGVTLDPVESAMIRDATERVLAGESVRALVREWNAAGALGTLGAPWTNKTLRGVLMRPRNAGLMEVSGSAVGAAQWPGIVDADTLHAVRAVLTAPSRRTQSGTERRWLGSGIYRCGRTDGVMICSLSGGLRPRPVYRLRDRQAGGTSRDAVLTDEVVDAVMVARLSRPDARGLLDATERPDTVGLTTEKVGLEARLDEAAAMFSDGVLTGAQLRTITEDLRGRVAALDTRLAAARAVPELSAVVAAKDVGTAWSALPVTARSRLVDMLAVVTILPAARRGAPFDPEDIRVSWRDAPLPLSALRS